jgi:hypothetical protein
MKCRVILLVALPLLAIIHEAAAQTNAGSVQWLYEQCKSTDTVKQDNCSAFLLGVAGVMEILGNTYENPPGHLTRDVVAPLGALGICSPAVSGAALREAFVIWAEKNRAAWDEKMPRGAMTALLAKWPCNPAR